jgi:BirA family biotin operon repressor/biotin-[acetyl-CoA-carboxylase] ligase
MDAERLAALLQRDCHLVVKDVVTSTNDEVLEQARTRGVTGRAGQVGRAPCAEPLPLVVVSKTQTAGRGRLGRTWASPPGGVYLSVLLGVDRLVGVVGEEALCTTLASLSPLTALAAWMAIQGFVTDEARIKWPNDLVSARGKLAGILVESKREVTPASVALPVSRAVVIGIGVNVNRPEQGASVTSAYLNDWPGVLEERSDTGLGDSKESAGMGSRGFSGPDGLGSRDPRDPRGQLPLEDVAAAVINELLGHYEKWREADCSFAPFVADYRARMAFAGEQVCVRDAAGNEVARGAIEGIDDQARLVLTGPQGPIAVVAGEVTLRDC